MHQHGCRPHGFIRFGIAPATFFSFVTVREMGKELAELRGATFFE